MILLTGSYLTYDNYPAVDLGFFNEDTERQTVYISNRQQLHVGQAILLISLFHYT
jgi:hypothetical protein